jgi:hypothetical protein
MKIRASCYHGSQQNVDHDATTQITTTAATMNAATIHATAPPRVLPRRKASI